MSITDDTYKQAFVDALNYQEDQVYKSKEHFPLFLMGNSFTTLIRARGSVNTSLKNMGKMMYESFSLKTVTQPHETFFFDQMTREQRQAVFNTSTFFNKQTSGLRLRELELDEALNKNLRATAVFKTHEGEPEATDFVAIAEGIKLPIYAFTYNLEMVQFHFEDTTKSNDVQLIDHSLVARKHAQYMANMIADETRLSNHSYSDPEHVFESLIRHEKLSFIKYTSTRPDQETMPAGLEVSDVYLL